ncbi:MAG: hypothetical protein WC272_06225 [Sulfurimonas sp.]|jgi:cell division protein FtsZ
MERRNFFKFVVAIYGLFGISANAKEAKQVKHINSPTMDKLCIIGIGGGGTNIVKEILKLDNTHIPIYLSSDYDLLNQKKSKHQIMLGWKEKSGLGCGGNAEYGKSLVNNDIKNKLNELTKSMETVYVISSLGGGIGSGVTPEIVEHLKTLNKKVIAFVTIPFSFEGKKRMAVANNSMIKIKEYSDTLVIFNNDSLLSDAKGRGVKDTFKLTSGTFYRMMKS